MEVGREIQRTPPTRYPGYRKKHLWVGGGDPSRTAVLVLRIKHCKGSWATPWLEGHFRVPPCLEAWSLRVIGCMKILLTILINKYTTLGFRDDGRGSTKMFEK